MIVDRNQKSLILTIRLLSDSDPPTRITGVTFGDSGLSIGYKKPNDSTWTVLTPVAGTLGSYTSAGWIEDSDSDGNYELGVPDLAAIPGKRTLWRIKHGGNQYRYFAVDYVAIPSAETDLVQFEFSIPGAEITFSSNSQIYTKETGLQVQFNANQNIESEDLVIIFETSDKVDQFVINNSDITKSGSTATITLPADFTNEVNSLNWAIREANNRRVYGTGTISVTYAPEEDS